MRNNSELVHPEYLKHQKLPREIDLNALWQERFESIKDHEKHLVREGTVILKFWLNISREEQKRRFMSRINDKHKNWKFSADDVKERTCWDDYMQAYEAALNATSKSWAPQYAIQSDDKPYMRLTVEKIIAYSLKSLHLQYPHVTKAKRNKFQELRKSLEKSS